MRSLDAQSVRDVFDYVDGVLLWRFSSGGFVRKGRVAGRRLSDGYWQIRFGRKAYRRARLVFLWHTGRWPEPEVDHRNRIRDDDRIENLRESTKQENAFNKSAKGYSRYAGKDRWRAYIVVDGRQTWLGDFPSEALARQARLAAKPVFHKIQEVNT